MKGNDEKMKLGLKEKIDVAMGAYEISNKNHEAEIRTMLEPYKMKGHRYTVDGLCQEIGEQMKEIVSDWKKHDSVVNTNVNAIVAEAKETLLKAIGTTVVKNKPADYATSISNAIYFLNIALDDVKTSFAAMDKETVAAVDVKLYTILKDFVDDHDTMKRFGMMVEKKYPGFIDANGNCIFPKTFGKTCEITSIMNTMDTMEAAAKNLFKQERKDTDEVISIQGISFSIPIHPYTVLADKATVENCAVILDAFADKIDSEGQSETSGSGQKVDLEGGAE